MTAPAYRSSPLLAVVGVLLLPLLLLLTGQRFLVHESRVEPQRFVEGYDTPGAQRTQATLLCDYFTGRSVQRRAYWYSPNNILGKDECPLFTSDSD